MKAVRGIRLRVRHNIGPTPWFFRDSFMETLCKKLTFSMMGLCFLRQYFWSRKFLKKKFPFENLRSDRMFHSFIKITELRFQAVTLLYCHSN